MLPIYIMLVSRFAPRTKAFAVCVNSFLVISDWRNARAGHLFSVASMGAGGAGIWRGEQDILLRVRRRP